MISSRTLGKTGIKVSPIGLGTTEIGYAYGIGPRDLPDEKSVIELLKRSVDLGITFIDTGHFYGVAEERIGKSGIAKIKGVVVSTKCGHVLDRGEKITDEELAKKFREEIEGSLKKLHLDCIPLVQIHGGSAEQISSGIISETMNALKKEGKLKHFGISTRGIEAPLSAIKDGNFETLQLAHSIFDQRMIPRVFHEAKKNNIGIINRSVLLKGALTPARQYLAPSLVQLRKNGDTAEKIAKEMGIDLPTLAIRFALSNSSIDTVLVGSNKIKNIESAVRASEAGRLPDDVIKKLIKLAINDPMEVDPKNWPSDYVSDVKDGKKIHTNTK